MSYTNEWLRRCTICLLLVQMAIPVLAQEAEMTGEEPVLKLLEATVIEDPMMTDIDDPSTQDPAMPVDGGLSLLLAAAAVYGGRRLLKRQATLRA